MSFSAEFVAKTKAEAYAILQGIENIPHVVKAFVEKAISAIGCEFHAIHVRAVGHTARVGAENDDHSNITMSVSPVTNAEDPLLARLAPAEVLPAEAAVAADVPAAQAAVDADLLKPAEVLPAEAADATKTGAGV